MGNVTAYLKPTYYIDYNSQNVTEKAEEFSLFETEERAQAIFYFVRDSVVYTPYSPFFLPEHYKASRILQRGSGYCVQKAVLLTALARANHIPARLVFANIKNYLIPEKLLKMMGTNVFVFHGYNELYIRERWVKVTPAFNIEMCKKLSLQSVEFDGHNDATFHAYDLNGQKHIEYTKDYGNFSDLPFENMMANFETQYSEDMLKRWKESAQDKPIG